MFAAGAGSGTRNAWSFRMRRLRGARLHQSLPCESGVEELTEEGLHRHAPVGVGEAAFPEAGFDAVLAGSAGGAFAMIGR